MQLANVYAGYSLGEADILRRAMSKKKVDLLKNEEDKFIRKSVEKGHSKDQAKELFNLVLNFAGYGFNKSHSVVYSIIAYKMAYLKCHFKTIFFANLLTNVIGSETKTNEYILEAKANKIEIEKPTINNSDSNYIVKENEVSAKPQKKKHIKKFYRQSIFPARTLESESEIREYVKSIEKNLMTLLGDCDGVEIE